jgi:hypothetical protein
MPLFEKLLVLSAAQGGERQRSSLSFYTGYSAEAHCIGTPSYLPPNSQSMQKTYRGEVTIGAETTQKHAEKTLTTPSKNAKPTRRLISLN